MPNSPKREGKGRKSSGNVKIAQRGLTYLTGSGRVSTLEEPRAWKEGADVVDTGCEV